jgi:hypothetical protein
VGVELALRGRFGVHTARATTHDEHLKETQKDLKLASFEIKLNKIEMTEKSRDLINQLNKTENFVNYIHKNQSKFDSHFKILKSINFPFF